MAPRASICPSCALPAPYELVWEPRGVYRRFHGHASVAERLQSIERICADPRFDELRHAITNDLATEAYEVRRLGTDLIVAQHLGSPRTNPDIVIATVAVDPAIFAAVERFIAMNPTARPSRIFATEVLARDWIT